MSPKSIRSRRPSACVPAARFFRDGFRAWIGCPQARFVPSTGQELPVVDEIVFLGMVVTGIGFMDGWKSTWFLGSMLGVAAVTYRGWALGGERTSIDRLRELARVAYDEVT